MDKIDRIKHGSKGKRVKGKKKACMLRFPLFTISRLPLLLILLILSIPVYFSAY
jgi:hypothetical protein